jgi:hypothetical protein
MKISNISNMVVIAGLALSSVALAADATFTNASAGFSLNYPSTWENVPNIKGTIMVYREPRSKTFSSTVNVIVVKVKGIKTLAAKDLPKITKAALDKKLKTITNYKEVKHEETTLGGQPAAAYIYTGDIGKSTGLKWYQLQTIYNEKGYTLTFTASADKFDAAKSVFDAMKNSFKFQ